MNLLGCVLFGISAWRAPSCPDRLGGGPRRREPHTTLGAACFLACALATLRAGRTRKSPGCGGCGNAEDVRRDVERIV